MSRDSGEFVTQRAIEDLDLVHACKLGSVAAFEELVKRYDVKLLRIACHITHNPEDAEEAVQDAFLKAYAKLEQFEGNASFSTWLTRIAVNESLLKLRKRRATTERWVSLTDQPEDLAPLDIADWAPNPEQLCSASELRAILLQSLKGLTAALRVVFVLRDMAGLSGDETAEVLGLGLSAVKARLLRARLQLRGELSKRFRKPALNPRLPNDVRPDRAQSEGVPAIPESGSASVPAEPGINRFFVWNANDGDAMWSAIHELLTQP